MARRCPVLLLLAGGRSWREIMDVAFCSSSSIQGVSKALKSEGNEGVLEQKERCTVTVAWWVMVVLRWLHNHTPREIGFDRWRWTCRLLALTLRDSHRVRISAETIRRTLNAHGLVWRRPRPVVGPRDPE